MITPESAVALATLPEERQRAGPKFPQRGAFGVALVTGAAAPGPSMTQHDVLDDDPQNAYLAEPGWPAMVGTYTQGQDVLSRALFGARLSLLVGV